MTDSLAVAPYQIVHWLGIILLKHLYVFEAKDLGLIYLGNSLFVFSLCIDQMYAVEYLGGIEYGTISNWQKIIIWLGGVKK